MAFLELYRGYGPGRIVAALGVVEHLDVMEYIRRPPVFSSTGLWSPGLI